MGKIKKIIENELIGGTQSTDIYPVTSIKAVYDENNESLDHILNSRGVINVSTSYNGDHVAEVLTLTQAIAKIPSENRVLGFQCRFLSKNGWESYIFTGDSIANWNDVTKWNKYLIEEDVVQGLGYAKDKVMSQNAVRTELSSLENDVHKKADTEQVNNSLYNLEKKIGDRVVVNGNVTNLPDEEDLTSVKKSEHDVLRLADRSYAPETFSGKGYKILRKNIQPVSIVVTKIRVESVPSSDGTLSFTINGKETQVSVSASTDNTISLVTQKVASEVKKSMTKYKVSIDDSLVTITRIEPSSITPSSFSSNNTGVVCTVSDDTKTELRNILTQDMVSSSNTIYEVRYDFTTIGKIHLSGDSIFYINGGSVDSDYVYSETDKILSIDENSGVFNSAVVSAHRTTINVNGIVNPKTSKVAINSATVNFDNGYIDRKDENGNYLDFDLGIYDRIFPTGRYRMFGNWTSNFGGYFRTIYTSEFKGLVKNNSLADIYEICIYKALAENFKFDLIVDSVVEIDRTINLVKGINIIGNGGSALIKVTINDPDVNVFEINKTFEFTLYNRTIKCTNSTDSGNYAKSIIVKGIVLYGISLKCNTIFKLNTVMSKLLLKDITVGTGGNRFFNKIFVCNTESTTINGDYTDFIILDNVSKNIILNLEDYDIDNVDVILGAGDCSTIINCSTTSFLIYGGQKYISNCMQSNIFASNCQLKLVNIHNEECNYYIDSSFVSFEDCQFMNAFNVTDSCMHINSGKVREYISKHFSGGLSHWVNNQHFLKLSFKNCQFMKPSTSPLPLKATNYDIKFYNQEDINNVFLDNTISVEPFNAGTNSTNISTNIKDLKGSKNTNASILDKMEVIEFNKHEITYWNPTIKRDEEYFKVPNSYDVKVNYIILLIEPKRQLGYKRTIDITYNVTEDAKRCLCLNLGKEYNDTSIILDCTIDGTHVQGYTHICEITRNNILIPILKTSILYSTPSIYLEDIISPVNVISQNDNNVEVTLNELPKLGTWNINDIVNVGALKYKYDGFRWVLINCNKGDSNNRPTLSLINEGFEYYDSTLKKKILWDGTAWVNLDGTELS